MENGKVKIVTERGFGFIAEEDSDRDVFFHERSLEGDLAVRKLKIGDEVTFDVEETQKGKNATNIKLVA